MKTTRTNTRTKLSRYMLIIPITLGLSIAAKAQEPPHPGPPPSPKEMLNKLTSPFKRLGKADSAKRAEKLRKDDSARKAGPTPPPNPMELFKKKDKKPATPPASI